jgi:undecaprenyl-diphosphatase
LDSGPRALAPLAFALAALALVWGAMLMLGTGALDLSLLDGFYAGGDQGRTAVALIITRFGDPDLLTIVSVLVALLLIARREVRNAALLLGISLSGRLLVTLQKAWIARPRPDAHLHLIGTRTDSFPSGHAASAVMVWITLALLIPREAPFRRPALAAAILAAAAAGISRPMLGVHWPSDVVAGWCFGLFWILLLLRLSGRPAGNALRPS